MNRILRPIAVGLLASLALVACATGETDTKPYRDSEDRTLFYLPNEWNHYKADEIIQLAATPFIPDLGAYPAVSYIAFDGAEARNLENLTLDVANSPFPIGANIVRQIGSEEKELLSRTIMANTAYDLVGAAQGVESIESTDFSFGNGYDGIRRLVGITDDDGELQGVLYLLAVTNPDSTELYSIAAGCSLTCFTEHRDNIYEAVDSWVVNTKR